MNRPPVVLGILLIVSLVLVSCGASKAPLTDTRESVSPSKGMPLPAAPTPAPAPAAAPTVGAGKETASSAGLPSVTDRLVIRNGNMTIVVKDVSEAVEKITDIANRAGGLVLRSDTRRQDDELYATVVIKVPAGSFDDVMSQLRKLAVKIDADSSSSQDVTEEYVDLDARLKVYEATEQQLLTFLQKTQNVDESMKVYRELTNVRTQIESLKGRMDYLKKSAAMSTITIQVKPEPKEKPIVEETGWSPLRVARAALRSLVMAMQVLVNMLIYAVLWLLPILIVIGIPVLLLRGLWRRVRRPRTAKTG